MSIELKRGQRCRSDERASPSVTGYARDSCSSRDDGGEFKGASMRVWFKNIAARLGLDDTSDNGVRAILTAAAARSAIVGIGSNEYMVSPEAECGMVDSVEEDALSIVFAPEMRGSQCILGESLSIAVATNRGFYRGKATVLSRWRDSGGAGSRARVGIRVSIPEALVHVQRRLAHRVSVAFDLAPRGQITRFDEQAPFAETLIMDVSSSGLRVRAPEHVVLEPGTLLTLDAQFPSAIPSFQTTTEVVRTSSSRTPKTVMIGLRFTQPMPELEKAIRALDLRRRTRSAA